jgi:hypothetical protein
MTTEKGNEFTTTGLWTWFLRITMGVVSFLIISLYQDLKLLITSVNDMKIMIAEQKKDIEYLKEGYGDMKQKSTMSSYTTLEQKQ